MNEMKNLSRSKPTKHPHRSRREPNTIILFGICRLGFFVAVVAHLLLLFGAAWMVFVEQRYDYVPFLLGYGLLSGLFIDKVINLFRKGKRDVSIRLPSNDPS
jgi:hypothetical protein